MNASLKHPSSKKGLSSRSICQTLLLQERCCSSSSSSSFQSRQHQLENDQIEHIKLGFYESRLTTSDYDGLCKSLHMNKSLTAVEIGMELPRPTLIKILDAVARLPCLKSLALIGLANLPRRLFQRLVSKPGLRHLELRNVTIGTDSESSRRLLSSWKQQRQQLTLTISRIGRRMGTIGVKKSPSSQADYGVYEEAENNVSHLLHSFTDSLQSLHLVACDFEDEDFIRICEWTERRPQKLDVLGFVYSNSMSSQALDTVISRAACGQLDLTSCSSFTIR